MLRVGPGEAAHGAEVIDRPATLKVLSIVAGQLEVGYPLGHVTRPGTADMRVVLHGHDRKVAI